jgi:4-aminobutyrate aminotransferase-like enzyme
MGKYPEVIGAAFGKGLVSAVQVVRPGTTEPDEELAFDVVLDCVEHGLLFFAPVGRGGGTVKISPPLCISEAELTEGLEVIDAAFAKALAARSAPAK